MISNYLDSPTPPTEDEAKRSMAHGARFPFDGTDEWWGNPESPAPQAPTWLIVAARGIIANLQDRRVIKDGFNNIDEDVRQEIILTIAMIIRVAHEYYEWPIDDQGITLPEEW